VRFPRERAIGLSPSTCRAGDQPGTHASSAVGPRPPTSRLLLDLPSAWSALLADLLLDLLNDRGLVDKHHLTDRGQAFAEHLIDTARTSLHALVADWSPPRIRASTTRSNASHASSPAKPRHPARPSSPPVRARLNGIPTTICLVQR